MDQGAGVTRRAALTRFAALAGGAAAAGLMPASAGAVAVGGFDDRRQAIFRALAEVYDGEGPSIKVANRDLVAEMTRRYAQRDADYRAWIDATLDALDVAAEGVPFSKRSLKGRRDLLRSWLRATEPADALIYRPRPGDASEPDNLALSNERNLALVKKFMASLPDGLTKLDPATGLSSYQPATPNWPKITDGLGPTGTPVRLRRQLSHSTYVLLVSFFVEDTRSVTVEAFA